MESIKSQRIPHSAIRLIVEASAKMEREGKEVIHLEIGRPDFNLPAHVVEACVEALRQAARLLPNARHSPITAGDWLQIHLRVSPGIWSGIRSDCYRWVCEAVYLSMNALLNPGDQILIPDPGWLNYEVNAICAFAEPVSYTLTAANEFQPDVDEIAAKITQRPE